jgi:hypothetical protein
MHTLHRHLKKQGVLRILRSVLFKQKILGLLQLAILTSVESINLYGKIKLFLSLFYKKGYLYIHCQIKNATFNCSLKLHSV